MSKKPKQVEESQEIAQEANSALMDEGSTVIFTYTDTTYAAVWNEAFNRYDMLRIRINSETEECIIDKREPTKYNTEYRALNDTMNKITNLYIKGEE